MVMDSAGWDKGEGLGAGDQGRGAKARPVSLDLPEYVVLPLLRPITRVPEVDILRPRPSPLAPGETLTNLDRG